MDMSMKGNRLRAGAAAVLLVLVLPAVAEAATKRLTVSGSVSGSESQNLAVLLVANDGTSTRAPVDASGKFSVKVSTKVAAKFVNGQKGKGPTLHVVNNGKYSGPVVLGKSGTKGYTRLTSKVSGTLKVGVISLKTAYASAKAAKTVVDTSKTIRMKGSAPVSSGSVREAAVYGPVRSFDAVVTDNTVAGADSDRDGLPNFADPDLNGDGVIDAAQPASTDDFGSSSILSMDRPQGRFGFAKIIEMPYIDQVNSNANPAVTEEQIRKYLTDGMSIEMLINPTPAELSSTFLVDCRKLVYCSAGSSAKVRAEPNAPLDGAALSSLANGEGLLDMPKRVVGDTRLLRFYPGMASASETNLTGDVYELIVRSNGVTVFSEVKVVTSSVVVPMAWKSFNGAATEQLPRLGSQYAKAVSDPTNVPVTFYRPQTFATGSTSQLLDRGGLAYLVAVWPEDQSNTQYACPATAIKSVSAPLVKAAKETPGGYSMFDSDQKPAANGTALGFTVDVAACVAAHPQNQHTLANTKQWWMELSAADSDNNKARIRINFSVP